MSIKSTFFNRRDMLKFGITAVGIAAMPKETISGAGIISQKPEDRIDKEKQRLLYAAKKHGGEFGSIEPEAGRT